jgi:hypothetical protein
MMTIDEARERMSKLEEILRSSIQKFHDETKVIPRIDIRTNDLTGLGEPARRVVFVVKVSGEI